MRDQIFKTTIVLIAIIFTLIFGITIIPPFLENPDIFGAFAAGFVNPYASGYSVDVFCCWAILIVWIIYESNTIRYGWVCILLGLIPGVAVGFALYLVLRMRQLKASAVA